MAAQHHTILTHPDFPQVLAKAIALEVSRVSKIVESHLSICCYVSPESKWGAGDAVECRQIAVVHDIATEQEFCSAHYGMDVRRG